MITVSTRVSGLALTTTCIKYDADVGEIYTHSQRGGAIDDGIVRIEGDQLNISTCGYFNYLDGRGGQWQGAGGSN